jgi:hypothetical protein
MFTLCSLSQGGPVRGFEFLPNRQPAHRLGEKSMSAQSIWENGDELPRCFLGRSRLGRPLSCAIRLRTQRSNHVAIK